MAVAHSAALIAPLFCSGKPIFAKMYHYQWASTKELDPSSYQLFYSFGYLAISYFITFWLGVTHQLISNYLFIICSSVTIQQLCPLLLNGDMELSLNTYKDPGHRIVPHAFYHSEQSCLIQEELCQNQVKDTISHLIKTQLREFSCKTV